MPRTVHYFLGIYNSRSLLLAKDIPFREIKIRRQGVEAKKIFKTYLTIHY